MKRWLMPVAGAVAATLTMTPVQAQVRSVTDELRLNVHASGVRLDHEDGGESVGLGGSLGYSSTRWFVPFITIDVANIGYEEAGPAADEHGTYRLRHLDAGMRFHLRGEQARVVPVVIAALTWRAAYYKERFFMGEVTDVKISGIGPTLGGGVLYYVRPRVAIEMTGKWTLGEMETITVDGLPFKAEEHLIDGQSQRINIGISLFPTGRTRDGEGD